MTQLFQLTKRNLQLYLRDKLAVFFSFLSVIILFAIYVLFLGNIFRDDFIVNFLTNKEIDFMIYSQMIPGILVISTMTISFGNLGTIIADLERRYIDGFLVTPVNRTKIVFSYYISSLLITIVISVFLLLLSFLVLGLVTGIFYTFSALISSMLLTIFFSFISTGIMVLIASFINSANAFGSVAGIMGSLVGFVSGIYMPLNVLPEAMGYVSSLVPFTHMNIALKQILLDQSLTMIQDKMGTEAYLAYRSNLGANEIGVLGFDVPIPVILVVSLLISISLLILATKIITNKIKK